MSRAPLPLSGSRLILPGEAYPNSPVAVRVDEFQAPGGTRRMVVVGMAGETDGVVVVARDSMGRLALVYQYRHALDEYLLELPRGFGSGTGPLADATRELREEVGAEAESAEVLGFVYPDSGLLASRVVVVRAMVSSPTTRPEDTEEIHSVKWLGPDEVNRSVLDGELRDGIGLAALRLESAVDRAQVS